MYKIKNLCILISTIVFLFPNNISFSCINLNRTFKLKDLENYKLLLKYKNNNFNINIPKDILILNNKNKYDLYINKLNNNKINKIDTFPYFVFK